MKSLISRRQRHRKTSGSASLMGSMSNLSLSKDTHPGHGVYSEIVSTLDTAVAGGSTAINHQFKPVTGIQEISEKIKNDPYNPNLWVERANTFRCLGYSELAAGDAFRCKLLLNKLRFPQARSLEGQVDEAQFHTSYRRLFLEDIINSDAPTQGFLIEAMKLKKLDMESQYMLVAALLDLGAYTTALRYCLSETEIAYVTRAKIASQGARPSMASVAYPWMAPEHLRRSPALIKTVRAELAEFGLTLQQSTVNPHKPDTLGIFALRDFAPGETLFNDRQFTAVLPPTQETFDQSGNIKAKVKVKLSNTAIFTKLITACATTPNAHPLDHPLIARLTPLYSRMHRTQFDFKAMIEAPVRTLQSLGVDIWKDARFETWALLTMWNRVNNNAWVSDRVRVENGDHVSKAASAGAGAKGNLTSGSKAQGAEDGSEKNKNTKKPTCKGKPVFKHRPNPIEGLGPLFSFLNHSCAPNAVWDNSRDAKVITVKAGSAGIKKGDEVFISYVPTKEMGLRERRKYLWLWLDAACGCGKCMKEEEEFVGKWGGGMKKGKDEGETRVWASSSEGEVKDELGVSEIISDGKRRRTVSDD